MTEAYGSEGATTAAGTAVDATPVEGRSAGDRSDLQRGDTVGRYVVIGALGAGGMGVVHAAYDPELDRKVALKLLRPEGASARSSDARTRLLREAQALARLSHPNVVAIHDVGTVEDRVFLAMELVPGRTLSAWHRAGPRPWREVLGVIIDVCRGVAAAHEAGLLHRDLKPDNVMVGDDGRVRVMDLGLARAAETASAEGASGESPASGARDVLSVSVTRVGSAVGTPAYMAPEQHLGLPADVRTDVFSLCVTAWEVLYGERPFAGSSLGELVIAVTEGRRRPVPRGSPVPRWVRTALERGLATQPGDRWESVARLLEALERGDARARRRRIVAAVGIAAMLAAASWLGTRMHEAALVASCEGAGTTIMEGWRGGRRDAVRQAVLASGLPRAERTADQILAWMDAGFDAWRETRTEACLNAEVRGSWSARDVELSTWCLEEVQMDLDAMSAELLEADASVARRAVSMASDKPTAPACLEIEVLRRLPEPPEEHREEIRSVRAELSRVGALTAAGRFDAALAGARAAHDRAAALAWPSLLASAGGMHGRALIRLGDYAAAEPLLEEAYFVALRAGDHRMAAATADVLCFLVGNHLSRHADGLRWSRHAEASHAALGGSGGDLTRVAHLENRGAVYFDMGKFAEAREAYERSLEIDERILGPDHPEVAVTLNNLANTYTVVGEYDKARRLLGRALAIREAALDPDHPDLALTLTNLGSAESAAGLDAEALAHYERSLAIWEASVGREHPEVGATLNNLGTVYAALGRTEEARAAWIRARGIWERAVGPDHPEVSYSLDNLAGLHAAAGEHAEARRLFERSLTIQEAALGPSHPDLVPALVGLAGVALAEGATAEARRLADRATALAGPGEHAAEVADDLRELQEALAVPVPPSSRP